MTEKGGISIAYVTIPKDLSQVKTKFLFNLTKRQVICFGCGILAGLMPFFLFAMYERNGEPLEKVLRHICDAKFKRPKQHPYKTNNFYTVLTRQAKLDKEVRAIVQGR